jgi:hypothetical protein
MATSKKDKMLEDALEAFPCMECPHYNKKTCDISECHAIEEYMRKTDIGIYLQHPERYDSYEETAREIPERGESPLARESRLDIDEVRRLFDKYKIIRPCEKSLLEQADAFWECDSIAKIAQLAGMKDRKNLHRKMTRRIRRFLKKYGKAEGIGYPPGYVDSMTPEKFKQTTDLSI